MAEQAYLNGDFERASSLYKEELAKDPDKIPDVSGLVRVLLQQEKVREAEDLVRRSLADHPRSAALESALGEVQYREGVPWLVGQTVIDALNLDICEPRAHLLAAKYLRLNSMNDSATREINTAHNLDPQDPEIRRQWINTLPLKDRITQLESYLASPSGDDAVDRRNLGLVLGSLKKLALIPGKACRVDLKRSSASIPFKEMPRDPKMGEIATSGGHSNDFGLDVKLNHHHSRLLIDTGASGLIVSRSVAERAGLKRMADTFIGGIGDQGAKSSYIALADDITIGSLEFRDCEVQVLGGNTADNTDGLIGTDFFSDYLVTLNYPRRKLVLGPLPRRAETAATVGESVEGNDYNDAHDRYIAPEMKDWTKVYRSGHFLMVPVFLNDSARKLFLLDTGAFSTIVAPDTAQEVTKVHRGSDLTVFGMGGKVEDIYTADRINFRFANLSQDIEKVTAFDTPEINKDVGMKISGSIGITALVQTVMAIDYRDGLVHFTTSPKHAAN